MALVTWLRALNAVGTVAEATRYFRGSSAPPDQSPARAEPAEPLETRLANVLVAALREAFDRDRARFDLERDLHDAEEARKERALRLEWLRQSGSQAVVHARHLALLSVAVWAASVAAAVWLAPLAPAAKTLLGFGWLGLFAAVGAGFITHRHLTVWLAHCIPSSNTDASEAGGPASLDPPSITAQAALPWLFLGGFVTTALSLVMAL